MGLGASSGGDFILFLTRRGESCRMLELSIEGCVEFARRSRQKKQHEPS